MNGTLLVAGILRNAEAFLPQWRQKLETLSQDFAAESWVEQNRDVVVVFLCRTQSQPLQKLCDSFARPSSKSIWKRGGVVFLRMLMWWTCRFSKNPQQISRRRHSRRLIWCRWTASIQVCIYYICWCVFWNIHMAYTFFLANLSVPGFGRNRWFHGNPLPMPPPPQEIGTITHWLSLIRPY